MRFQVHTAASMKKTAFWDDTPYSPLKVYWRFGGGCLHNKGDALTTEAASTFTKHVCRWTAVQEFTGVTFRCDILALKHLGKTLKL
jgi:hypothetical protein